MDDLLSGWGAAPRSFEFPTVTGEYIDDDSVHDITNTWAFWPCRHCLCCEIKIRLDLGTNKITLLKELNKHVTFVLSVAVTINHILSEMTVSI